MIRQVVLFDGLDSADTFGLWETNGTASGTYELTGISGASDTGIFITSGGGLLSPDLTAFNDELLFAGLDAAGVYGLWRTDGTTAETYELTGISGTNGGGLFAGYRTRPQFTDLNGELLFEGNDNNGIRGLWVTDGTAIDTHGLTGIGGENASGFFPGVVQPNFALFNGEVLFEGVDASGAVGLWVTNGTAAGTQELTGISGVNANGLFAGGGVSPQFTAFDGHVLFAGTDAGGAIDLWVTNGTAAGTYEITGISGADSGGGGGFQPVDFTLFDGEVLLKGLDSTVGLGLWITNGTASGTYELTGIRGVSTAGLFLNTQPYFTPFNGEVIFAGTDINQIIGLWVTNGTSAGTHELTGIAGALNGVELNPTDLTVLNGEVLFSGDGGNLGGRNLWETDGTAAGTHRLNVPSILTQGGLAPTDSTSFTELVPPADDFNGNNTSDVLFRNNSNGDTWFEAISNGAFNSWNQIGSSDTTYGVVGTGAFFGTGSSEILYRNNSTGSTAFEETSNGAFAGWNQIGGSNTFYSVAGTGDFYGAGTSDILFRNNSTGDTWFEQMTTGPFAGWHQIGRSDTQYSVVGVGDFFGTGADDILFRNNSTGDTWLEVISNGAFAGWNQIGGSDTHYSAVGVGDFFGNGTNDILFRNNSAGDTWFEGISNGAFAGWHQIGGSDTTYSIVGIGDYFGTNTSDILFRNNATGDTWFEAISNGAFAGWNHIGVSNTSYSVPITVGPAA
jgi:hypothetical protein